MRFELIDDGFEQTAPVGSFLQNPWGLHDVIGNVMEWCEDIFDLYPGNVNEGVDRGYSEAGLRVFRGGGYHRARTAGTLSDRSRDLATYSFRAIGVRAARSLDGR